MINPKNKRIQITLDPETNMLLTTICLRFNINQSNAIKQAIKIFAAKKKHIFTIKYQETENNSIDDKTITKNEEIEILDTNELLKRFNS